MFELESAEVDLVLPEPYETAQVRVRVDVTTDGYLAMRSLTRAVTEDSEWVEEVFRAIAGVLVSWNLARGGKKIPTTPAGVRSVPLPVLVAIAYRWLEVLVRPSGPLSLPSPTIEPVEE